MQKQPTRCFTQKQLEAEIDTAWTAGYCARSEQQHADDTHQDAPSIDWDYAEKRAAKLLKPRKHTPEEKKNPTSTLDGEGK